ncbi:MAG: nucleotidyltransferase family protein [Bacteroidetes bacterium]|nr:nucleotidyltransferase family protein [Bacteroidota bacterium]
MNAMIFAAGLGTRLRPLTDDKPKALVELNGQTLLQITIQKLQKAGFNHIVVNVHHFSQLVIDYLNANNNFGVDVLISDESDFLLDTGGGLKKASPLFIDKEPILIHNVDIISSINLTDLYQTHCKKQVLATLAVRNRPTSRVLLFDENNLLRGWKNIITGALKLPLATTVPDSLHPYAFSGIQIVNHELLQMISETGKFSMIDVYLRLSANHPIMAYQHDADYWNDVGKHEQLDAAVAYLSRK